MNNREIKTGLSLLNQVTNWAGKDPKRAGCAFGCLMVVAFLIGGVYMVYHWLRKPSAPTTTPPTVTGKPPTGRPRTLDEAKNLYLQLGNPSQATPDTSNANNYLMVKMEYALSYSRQRGAPNWVSWHVGKADLGNLERADDFRPDDALPSGWPRVTPSDFGRSGYDRGHVCPSADRTSDPQANSATFLMTNMVAQTADNNRGPWKALEEYSRSLVSKGEEVYIVAGAYGQIEQLRGKVSVPTNTWKVVVVMPQGATNAAQVTGGTRVIAINIPNVNGIKDADWRKYRVSVRAIESATGYNLLSNVRQDVQNAIETRVDDK